MNDMHDFARNSKTVTLILQTVLTVLKHGYLCSMSTRRSAEARNVAKGMPVHGDPL
jgi:hypothetical protein